MLGAKRFLKRKMPRAFVQKGEDSWYVIRYVGLHRFNEKAHYGITVAIVRSRVDARRIARRIRGEK